MTSKRFNKVAVLKGGPSTEREVSLRSGAAVAGGLREAGYEVSEVDVTARTLDLPAGIEAVFIALHGEFGEDGQVQAMLDMMRIPYTGSGSRSSDAAMDKGLSKKVFLKAGIPTPEYEMLRRGGRRKLSLPVVVKPLRQGSSLGVHRVFEESEWNAAIDDVFTFGDEALVERYIEGRELTAGIVGDRVLPLVEIRAAEWYSYNAKYKSGGTTEYLVPAPVDSKAAAICSKAAWDTFAALGCRGLGRVDLRMDTHGRVYVLELNSIPGFTETSLLPKAARQAGMSFPELCGRIIEMAAFDSAP